MVQFSNPSFAEFCQNKNHQIGGFLNSDLGQLAIIEQTKFHVMIFSYGFPLGLFLTITKNFF